MEEAVIQAQKQALRAEIEATFGVILVDGTPGNRTNAAGTVLTGTVSTFTLEQLQDLKRILGLLPPAWRGSMSGVTIKAFGVVNRQTPSGSGLIAGVYWWGAAEIWMSQLAGSQRAGWAGTLVHEMTHLLSCKDPTVNERWRAAFWGGNRAPPPPPVTPSPTDYGATNAEEDMAESVMIFVQMPDRLDPARRQFIERFIFPR